MRKRPGRLLISRQPLGVARDHRALHRRTDHLLRDRRVEHPSINTIIDPGTLSPEPSRRPPKQHLSARLLILRQRTPGRLQLLNSREVSHPIRLLQWYEKSPSIPRDGGAE